MIAHRGVVLNFALDLLAHVQLVRAKAMTEDKDSARKAYREFFALWKDADPERTAEPSAVAGPAVRGTT